MRYVVSEIILHTLQDMDPKYPVVTEERLEEFAGYKAILEQELGKKDKQSSCEGALSNGQGEES